MAEVIDRLNLFLRGWGNYFRTGNAADKFVQLDRHVAWRLKRLLIKKRGRNLRAGQASTMDPDLVPRPGPAPAHGHHPLPEGGVTMSRRPSVSRMRENRTYGLKGGWGNGPRSGTAPLTTNDPVAIEHHSSYGFDRRRLQPQVVRLRPAPHCRTP